MMEDSPVYNVNTNNIMWGNLPNVSNTMWTTTNSGKFDWGFKPNPYELDVNGDANFKGDIKVKGKSLSETLERIEERLAILHRNNELEEKWDDLKVLGEKYKALERDILEKEKIWNLLEK
jgi:hypothetical protein